MAEILAKRYNANLALVARRVERLVKIQVQLQNELGVGCEVVQGDLANTNEVERVFREITKKVEVYGVILNAGVTHFGPDDQLDWKGFDHLVRVNVIGTVSLLKLFIPYLKGKNFGGGIMVISSLAGYLPIPFQAAYSGSKGFFQSP